MTLQVVLDANVIVSGVASLTYGNTAPPTILRRWYAGDFDLIASSAILTEVRNALAKPYFLDVARNVQAEELLQDLDMAAEIVLLSGTITGIATHPHDDRIIEIAVLGDAEYLVTGDKELNGAVHPYPFRIVHPKELISLLDPDSGK